jgi:signal transduction histidine kinase
VLPTNFLRTVTFRIAFLQALLFAAVVAGLFSFVWSEVRDYVEEEAHRSVEVETASLLQAVHDGTLAAQIHQRMTAVPVGQDYYLLSSHDGTKIAGNLNFSPKIAGWQTLPLTGAEGKHAWHANHVELLVTPLQGGNWLTVGRDNRNAGELDEDLSRYFRFSVIFMVLFATLSGALAGYVFVKRVDRLGGEAERILTGDASGSIQQVPGGAEFARLAGRLNRMLARIHILMDNMRQVSNDIAHDLRTPLTRLRQRLESARLGKQDAATLAQAIDDSIVDVDDVLTTFGALLRISRIESMERQAGFAPLDLSDLFASIVDVYAPVAEDHGKNITADIAPCIQSRGDRALLTQMLSNLIENAIQHTPPGTQIAVSLQHESGDVLGSVKDDGAGIPSEHHEHVFRRFFRLDSSRSSAGSGLGLALVAAVADLHRILIDLCDCRPGLAVTMRFPNA